MGRRRAFRRFGLVAVLIAALPVMYVGAFRMFTHRAVEHFVWE